MDAYFLLMCLCVRWVPFPPGRILPLIKPRPGCRYLLVCAVSATFSFAMSLSGFSLAWSHFPKVSVCLRRTWHFEPPCPSMVCATLILLTTPFPPERIPSRPSTPAFSQTHSPCTHRDQQMAVTGKLHVAENVDAGNLSTAAHAQAFAVNAWMHSLSSEGECLQ